jgi:glutamyl-tRNA synthetase
MNGVYIRSSSVAVLAGEIEEYLEREEPDAAAAVRADPGRLQEAVRISQEKIQTLKEFWPLAGFLFGERAIEEKARARWLDENGVSIAVQARAELAALQADAFGERSVQQALEGLVERLQVKPGNVYQPLRVAISGKTTSPGIFESIALLGQKETLRRIDVAAGNGRQ